jgi:hypothetical protein
MMSFIGVGLVCFLLGLVLPSFLTKKKTVSTPVKVTDAEVKKESDVEKTS